MLCSMINASGWKKSKLAMIMVWRKSKMDSRSSPERYLEYMGLSLRSMSSLMEGSLITSIPSSKKI